MRFKDVELLLVGLVTFSLYVVADGWLPSVALLTLWIALKLVATNDRLFALPLALTFQWSQVTLGVFYLGLTGRAVPAVDGRDYPPMVLIGLSSSLPPPPAFHPGFFPPNPLHPHHR